MHKKCIKALDGNTIKVTIAQNKFLKYPNLILKTGNNQKNSLWAVKTWRQAESHLKPLHLKIKNFPGHFFVKHLLEFDFSVPEIWLGCRGNFFFFFFFWGGGTFMLKGPGLSFSKVFAKFSHDKLVLKTCLISLIIKFDEWRV